MSAENRSWGQERIPNELMQKLGIQVSSRTVQKYLNTPGPNRQPDPKQRWLTFVRNHANAIVASDFFVVVTAQFRILYVNVCIELGTRRILHYNVTAHPTAEWTLQQSHCKADLPRVGDYQPRGMNLPLVIVQLPDGTQTSIAAIEAPRLQDLRAI